MTRSASAPHYTYSLLDGESGHEGIRSLSRDGCLHAGHLLICTPGRPGDQWAVLRSRARLCASELAADRVALSCSPLDRRGHANPHRSRRILATPSWSAAVAAGPQGAHLSRCVDRCWSRIPRKHPPKGSLGTSPAHADRSVRRDPSLHASTAARSRMRSQLCFCFRPRFIRLPASTWQLAAARYSSRSRFRSVRRAGSYRARRSLSVGCRLCRPYRLWHDYAVALVDRRSRRSRDDAAPPILSIDLARCSHCMGRNTLRIWIARYSPRFCRGGNDASGGDLDPCCRPAARTVFPRPRPRPALALRLHRASRFDLRLFDHLRPCFCRAALGRRTAPTAAVHTAAARPFGNPGVPLSFDCRLGRHRRCVEDCLWTSQAKTAFPV